MRGRWVKWMRRGVVGIFTVGTASCAAPADELRVLFVGNSRIYYYNQPAIVEVLADGVGVDVTAKLIASGGASLQQHINGGVALEEAASGSYDYVVLNEQGTWDINHYVQGVEMMPPAPESFYAAVERFAAAAEEGGAELVLLMQPRKRDRPDRDIDELISAFRRAEERVGARIAPVGLAHRIMESRHPELGVWDPDGNHPSAYGAFLSAATIWHVIGGTNPHAAPQTISGFAVGFPNGTQYPDSTTTLVELESGSDSVAFATAAEAIRAWEAGEPLTAIVTDYIEDDGVPTLPQPDRAPDASEISGRWTGPLALYPRFLTWPSTLSLDLSHADGRLEASFRLSFGGSPPDITYRTLPISDEGAYYQFVDPDGPNGGIVRYRVAAVGDSLIGIGEFMTDVSVYGIGELRLGR